MIKTCQFERNLFKKILITADLNRLEELAKCRPSSPSRGGTMVWRRPAVAPAAQAKSSCPLLSRSILHALLAAYRPSCTANLQTPLIRLSLSLSRSTIVSPSFALFKSPSKSYRGNSQRKVNICLVNSLASIKDSYLMIKASVETPSTAERTSGQLYLWVMHVVRLQPFQ